MPMRILYAARLARFDLLRITCKLATRISRWDENDARRLLRLIRYIHNDDRQVGFLGYEMKERWVASVLRCRLCRRHTQVQEYERYVRGNCRPEYIRSNSGTLQKANVRLTLLN